MKKLIIFTLLMSIVSCAPNYIVTRRSCYANCMTYRNYARMVCQDNCEYRRF